MEFFHNDWDNVLKGEFESEYFQKILNSLDHEYATHKVYPQENKIFSAFKLTPYKDVKVVIIGQDPYHGEGQAHGLAFSVMPGVPIPPSLVNIFKEIASDLGGYVPDNGYLVPWAKQGVLLLNTVLTVREGQPNSHRALGWERFTDAVIKALNQKENRIVFLLWGNNAKQKAQLIDQSKHSILYATHPSPLSAYGGFFGCKHFSKTNQILKESGQEPINWQIENIMHTFL